MKIRKVLAWLIAVVPVGLLTGFDKSLISQEKKALQLTGVMYAVKNGLFCSNSFTERVQETKSDSIPEDRRRRKQNLFWIKVLYGFSSLASRLPKNSYVYLLARPITRLGMGAFAVVAPLHSS